MSRESRSYTYLDRVVLIIISVGLIAILLSIIWGLLLTHAAMPNWAENVLVAIATASALKLGDCLSTLVALASGRQSERLSEQLGTSAPPKRTTISVSAGHDGADAAVVGAEEVADAADEKAAEIAERHD